MMQNFLKNIEWALLRGTLIWAVACFSLGVTALVISYEYKVSKKEAEERQELQLRSLSSKLQKTIKDEKIYQKYLPRLERQIDKGYVGDLNRVVWVDILHEVTAKLKLPDIQYDISEQSNYVHNGRVIPEGDFQIVSNLMQITTNLFHEDDLFGLLDLLREKSNSFYQVDQCSIRQSRPKAISEIGDPNLNVHCELVWIALQYSDSITTKFKKSGKMKTLGQANEKNST